jgi:hypothetical protein
MTTDAIDRLLGEPPFAVSPTATFVEAVGACLAVLRQRFPRYDHFLRRHGGPATAPASLAEIDALPALFLPVLKGTRFDLPADLDLAVQLTSSGTTGQPSVVPQDRPSWQRRVAALLASYRGVGVLEGEFHALAFLLEPGTTRLAGSLVIDAALKSVQGLQSLRYLARQGAKGPDFDLLAAAAALGEAARLGPVLLVGYPALIAAAIHGLGRTGVTRLPLPAGSRVLTGGGWKSFLPGVALDQDEFRRQVSGFFDLPGAAVRDMFGLSESPAVFVQCEHGRYHIPAFARARAVDPETGRDVPAGAVGLLELTVPLTTSYPLLKILTTDKATLQTGCPCGRPGPCLTPCGRASAARYETCAMQIGRAVGPASPAPAGG